MRNNLAGRLLELPVEINGHGGFTDLGGADWDIAGSREKVLECSDTYN